MGVVLRGDESRGDAANFLPVYRVAHGEAISSLPYHLSGIPDFMRLA